MKKLYEKPEILIRNYALPPRDIVMTSDPSDNNGNDLDDGDDHRYEGNDYFG